MTAATQAVSIGVTPWGDSAIKRPLIATAQTWYPGIMTCLDGSGWEQQAADTSGYKFDGILQREGSPIVVFSGEANGDRSAVIERPWRFTAKIAAAVQGDEGKQLYVVDNQTVGYTSSNSILVGTVDQVLSATSVLVNPLYAPLNPVAITNNTIAFTGSTGANTITFPDNLANGLTIEQGSNPYLQFVSTDGSELTKVLGTAATAVTNTGGGVQVTGGIGGATSGAGGSVVMAGGAGTNNALGGVITMTGGAGQGTGAGAAASVIGGAGGATGAGGAVIATGGAGGGTSGSGGAITLTAGAGTGTSAAGGVASLVGGASVTAVAGGISKIVGGVGGATGAGGAAQVTGGAGGATSGTGGAVTIAGGAGTNGNANGGAVTINGGALNGSGLTGVVAVQSSIAPPAAGLVSCGLQISSTAGLGVYVGSAAPTFSAAQGALYLRTDGSSSSTRAYINSTGSTTWVAVTTAS